MTKILPAVCITFLSAAFACESNAQSNMRSDSPSAALLFYYRALKSGDVDAAKKLTANFTNQPPGRVSHYTIKYAEAAKGGNLRMKLVPKSFKILKDCAVVTFDNGEPNHPDYDPAYLLKQNGQWKVFLKLTDWDSRAFQISEDQTKKFKQLEMWFDQEKDRISGPEVRAGAAILSLKTAIISFYTEYRKYPVPVGPAKKDELKARSDHKLMDILLGADRASQLNPRGIVFFEGKEARPMGNGKFSSGIKSDSEGEGELWDPWGNYYYLLMGARESPFLFSVWSAGKDGVEGTGDDIKSR